jgi:SAM-dependent methyltransferase
VDACYVDGTVEQLAIMTASLMNLPTWRLGFVVFFAIAVMMLQFRSSSAFSMVPKGDDEAPSSVNPSRRELFKSPVAIGGALVYAKLVADAAGKLARGDLVYPAAHETRVEDIIARAALASIPSENRPLRVLEVGIGKDWRVGRRGLYHSALDQLSSRGVTKLELSGVDISVPNAAILEDASSRINQYGASHNLDVNVHVIRQSITSRLDFPDGWFDCVVGSLLLCSVDDQDAALQEIKRLVRPTGGTFGYVEHVAVNPDEPYQILDWQQKLLDPFQQAVAENCHLHRFTDDTVSNIFGIDDTQGSASATRLFSERFLVKDMWPVSCQCCGVVQRIA